MSERGELLPCPFCGDDTNLDVVEEDVRDWIVRCDDCLASGPLSVERTRNDAIAAWNRRAPSPTTEGVEASGGIGAMEAVYGPMTKWPPDTTASTTPASGPAGVSEEPVLDGHLIGDAPESSSAPTEPTPAALREWAEWFDNPKNPCAVVLLPTTEHIARRRYTAGHLLRRIADAMEGR